MTGLEAEPLELRAGQVPDERTLRLLAELLRRELSAVVPDPHRARVIDAALAAALALPPGPAGRALRRALGAEQLVRAWVGAQVRRGDIRDRLLSAAIDDGIPARFLTVRTPTQVELDQELPVEVRITEQAYDRSARCQPFAVPPDGVDVQLVVTSGPGLRTEGPALLRVRVPENGDSVQVLFRLRAVTVGPTTVLVRAYLSGRPIGDQTLAVEVAVGTRHRAVPTISSEMVTMTPDEWNLTLQIDQTTEGYRCQLLHPGDSVHGLVTSIPTAAVEAVRRHLFRLAEGSRRRDTADLARHDLRDLGLELWEAALPGAVRTRFSDLVTGARTLSVVTDQYHRLPWELLLPPPTGRNEAEFLAEIIPVLRRIPEQTYMPLLAVRDAAYVNPPSSLTDTSAEIAQVREVLGPAVRHQMPAFTTQADFLPYLEAGEFDLLHLACHNSSPQGSWQEVSMSDGPFYCINLNQAVHQRSLARRHPLVFFNACDSAGRPADTAMTDWATRFLRAGAGAFVGSTWAVRSGTAMRFAAALYQALRAEPDLGRATLHARREVGGVDGDPTRLAYAVYASVGTTVRWAI